MNIATMTAISNIIPAVRTALDRADVPVDVAQAPAVAAAVAREVAPILVHETNNEPWYQSRVTIGALLAFIGASYTLGLDFADGIPPTVEVLTAQAGIIVGSLVTLYGRWRAKKPIGA